MTVNNMLDTQNAVTTILVLIKGWMNKKTLKLNEEKTGCLFVGEKSGLTRFNEVQSLSGNGSNLCLSDKVNPFSTRTHNTLIF